MLTLVSERGATVLGAQTLRVAQAGAAAGAAINTAAAPLGYSDGAVGDSISSDSEDQGSDEELPELQRPVKWPGGPAGGIGAMGPGRGSGEGARAEEGPMPRRRRPPGGAHAGARMSPGGSAEPHDPPPAGQAPTGAGPRPGGSAELHEPPAVLAHDDAAGEPRAGGSASAAAEPHPEGYAESNGGAAGELRESGHVSRADAGAMTSSAALTPVGAPGAAAAAAAALADDGVIAVPTDTLYGLACDAASTAGVAAIYAIKALP